jgi:hypothetical protein
VTAYAGIAQTKKSFLNVDGVVYLSRIISYISWIVTVPAGNVLMLPEQWISRAVMTEVVHAVRPVNKIEIPAVMVAVTCKACLALLRNCNVVQSFPCRESLLYFQMAGQALDGTGAATKVMTFCAIGYAFEVSVRPCQLSR